MELVTEGLLLLTLYKKKQKKKKRIQYINIDCWDIKLQDKHLFVKLWYIIYVYDVNAF